MKTESSLNPLPGILLLIALGLSGATPVSAAAADIATPKGAAAKGVDSGVTGEEIAVLTQAPQVPPPIKRSHPTKVIVKLEVREVVKRMADGVDYLFGRLEACRAVSSACEGDLVEFTANHPSAKMPHNIDLRGHRAGWRCGVVVYGTGHSSQFSFKR
jgi:nitrite reductase (NO-forming)